MPPTPHPSTLQLESYDNVLAGSFVPDAPLFSDWAAWIASLQPTLQPSEYSPASTYETIFTPPFDHLGLSLAPYGTVEPAVVFGAPLTHSITTTRTSTPPPAHELGPVIVLRAESEMSDSNASPEATEWGSQEYVRPANKGQALKRAASSYKPKPTRTRSQQACEKCKRRHVKVNTMPRNLVYTNTSVSCRESRIKVQKVPQDAP
jgi:hypothetical protein